ncbi:TIGR02996 domain-containing protein [Gemmata sp. JC717]|uniref:TIGR02996 domain-containing protein n=1 Tax=Gemmata algarum TaxID=2975278 RepID=UPI0021BA8DA0|nr:TIGR02996 domain-containing protein [Gemmata algarum]MDY3555634.1 TIGR02996 domain-containing protein [Gemmata algarum]
MNDHDALLRAIGEQPEEDTPRLMYADWLEEQGQPERADFVRNQVELARPGLSAIERYRAVRRNVHYLSHFVKRWHAELPRIPNVEWGDFNRGLIEEVRAANERAIVARAAEIFAVPGVHVVRLWSLSDGGALAAVPELTRLRSFRLLGGAPAGTLRDLFRSPHLARLAALDLYNSRVDDALASEIADGRFRELRELLLGANAVGNVGGRALAASPHLAGLRKLDLRGNSLDHPTRALLLTKFASRVNL